MSVEKIMATDSSILAWKIPGRGAWQATVNGVAKGSDTYRHTHLTIRMFHIKFEISDFSRKPVILHDNNWLKQNGN